MVHITENGEEMVIKNDQDYADLIDYSTNNNLKEVDIVIIEKQIMRKKKEMKKRKMKMKEIEEMVEMEMMK